MYDDPDTGDQMTPEEMLARILTSKRQKKGQKRNKARYRQHYRDFLTHAVMTQFTWRGLGEHVEPRFVEKTLLEKGIGFFYHQAAGEVADFNGDGVLEVPRYTFREAVEGGSLNDQWVTTEYRTLSPGAAQGRRVHRTAGELAKWDGVPLYDNINHDTYMRSTISFYANRLAEAALTVDVNMDNTRTQRIITVDQDQAKSAQIMDDLIGSGSGTALLKPSAGKSIADSVQVLDMGIDPMTVETNHGVFIRLRAEALNALGINAEANEKSAQQSVDEINSDRSMVAAIRMSRLDSRRWFVDKVNKRFDLKLEVLDSGTGR